MTVLFILSFSVLIPIIVGLVLVLSGNGAGVWVLAAGTPAVMVILLVVGLIMLSKGKLYKKKPKDDAESSEKESEQAAINAVNNSVYFMSRFRLAEYEARHVAEGMKNSSGKGIAIGLTFMFAMVALVVSATVLAIKEIWAGAIVCGALFVVSVVAGILTAVIREKLSMRGDLSKTQKFVCGKVRSCIMSSMASVKINRAKRIRGVVYNVVVSAGDAEYSTFSDKFYETDEKAVIAFISKKSFRIVEEADLEKQSDEIKNGYKECLVSGETVTVKNAERS